jgi:hypothetical protein
MKRTQIGWVIIVGALLAVGLSLYGKAQGLTLLYIVAGMVLMVILFCTLTLKVDDEYVRFSFGIGLFHAKYKISNIEICWPITYFPLGWGIRFRPGVILFNVTGNKAIKLRLKGKNQEIWIGTNYPDEFAAYINSKMKKKPLNPPDRDRL